MHTSPEGRRYTLYRDAAEIDWRQRVFEHLVEHLRERGLDVGIEARDTFDLRLSGVFRRTIAIRDSLAVLQEHRSGEFRVLDCHDWVDPDDVALMVRDPRCRVILKCQYSSTAFRGRRFRILRPWTYFDQHWPAMDDIDLQSLRARPRAADTAYFRGYLWDERARVVPILQQRGVLNADESPVPYHAYLEESARAPLILSLPGMAEFCHRDVEGFAIGTPVLRPRLFNSFHDDLEADRHYVSVDTDIEKDPPEVAAARIEERFRQVVGDADFLRHVADNAMRWYDRNVPRAVSMPLTASLLGLAP